MTTFSQEETLAGGVPKNPNVRGLQKHRLHRNSRTAKKATDGLASVATAPWAQPIRPRSVLLCYSALQLTLPQLLIGHWKVSCVAFAHQGYRLDYLQ